MKYLQIFLVFFLVSCSASWHLNKAVKKGAELEVVKVPEYVYDTIYDTVENKVIIRTRIKDTLWNEKTVVKYVPKTRIEYRYDYKRFKDSLRHYRRVYSDSLQNAFKTAKIENRTERKKDNRFNRIAWWFMAFFVVLLIIYILGKILAEKLFK